MILEIISLSHNKREALKINKGCCIWFTGLSGSGKSTLANILELKLNKLGVHTYLLDGDILRKGLNNDLGFTEKDREENIRRAGEVAKLFVDAGIIIISAFISPYEKDRNKVRCLIPDNKFIEVFVDTEFDICEKRDIKGLYKKARNNEIKNFTGITAPYEKPTNPDLILKNNFEREIELNIDLILKIIRHKKII